MMVGKKSAYVSHIWDRSRRQPSIDKMDERNLTKLLNCDQQLKCKKPLVYNDNLFFYYLDKTFWLLYYSISHYCYNMTLVINV